MEEISRLTFGDWALVTYAGGQVLYKDNVFVSANFGPDIEVYNKVASEVSGAVFISGMGIGILPKLLQLNPNVTRVTVVEIDPVLCDFHRDKLPNKTTLIQGDARFYTLHEPHDYGIHDIWSTDRNELEEQLLADVYRGVIAKQACFFELQKGETWR